MVPCARSNSCNGEDNLYDLIAYQSYGNAMGMKVPERRGDDYMKTIGTYQLAAPAPTQAPAPNTINVVYDMDADDQPAFMYSVIVAEEDDDAAAPTDLTEGMQFALARARLEEVAKFL